ncbi:hypothetical protein [uncultured Algibacter sp.]|uniref:hypothetical protein n=1 Tax=uncultured Algibacter sp. TaxID=298659 RepID=UPI0030EF5FFB|tara:strand:- start:628 stop:1071 length:444 start_codon:yes stop_codon:yes gene_type:complete
MENSLNNLTNDLFLRQSELFGEDYEETGHIHTFNDLSISDLDDWFNSVLTKFDFLNEIQIKSFQNFVIKLNYVLRQIDPNKLKINDDSVEDSDLLLWRESDKGISMITFDEFGQIAYNYVGKNGKKVKGVFNQDVDMEKLLYKFISM